MKRLALLLLTLSFTTAAFAQANAFEKMKTLAGKWEGPMTTNPKVPEIDGKPMNVEFRVVSMGNTLMHEMTGAGRPDDPITMFYLDAERLTLTHFCDAGNRPRMTAKVSEDGKRIEFDFLDVAGSTEYGYMRRAVFTFIDENHHTEDWTYMMPGEKPMRAHVELKRTQAAPAQPSAVHQHSAVTPSPAPANAGTPHSPADATHKTAPTPTAPSRSCRQ